MKGKICDCQLFATKEERAIHVARMGGKMRIEF
jgi:hypothetical protein